MSEAADPFAEAPAEDDPFADPPASTTTAAPAAAPAQAPAEPAQAPEPVAEPVAEPPIVNREGEAVEGPLETSAEDRGEDPAATDDPQPPDPDAVLTPPPVQSSEPEQAPEAQQAPAVVAEEPQVTEAPTQEAPPATQPEGGGEGSQPAAASSSSSQLRLYKLLYQTGEKQYSVVDLTSVPAEVKKHVRKVDGDHYLEARNNDHAYRLAFSALGRPQQGATVWPVPKASFRPRRVAPKPPEPDRERLVIS